MLRILLLTAFTLLPVTLVAQTVEDALGYLRAEDYERSFAIVSDLAADGDAEAQSVLAWHYYYGRGTETDQARAAELWQAASDAGYARASYNLAGLYLNGNGVRRDGQRSADLYEKAGDQGLADGHFQAGIAYQIGRGVGIHGPFAFVLFSKAAEAGHYRAKLRVADALVLGEVIQRATWRAKRLYRELEARRDSENLRLPPLRPRMREVVALENGEPFNSELFRQLPFSRPAPGETDSQHARRQSDLINMRIAARTEQIVAERRAALDVEREDFHTASCSPAAPPFGAIVDRQGGRYHVVRAASGAAARLEFSTHRPVAEPRSLRFLASMRQDLAEELAKTIEGPVGLLLIRPKGGDALGPGWLVNNSDVLSALQFGGWVFGGMSLTGYCPSAVLDYVDEETCRSGAEQSWTAFGKAIETGAEDLVVEYLPDSERIVWSQPLELLAPEVYELASNLVEDDKMSGTFPILRCEAGQ